MVLSGFVSAFCLCCLLASQLSVTEARLESSRWIPSEIIPTRMVGTHLDEEIHTTKIQVGTPPRELWLVIDFASDSLVISSAPSQGAVAGDIATSDPADWSSSYSPVAGGSDMIRLSGRRYRVPTSHNPRAAALTGCPACHGVLGVGAGSPLWLVWNRATFSAGAITLGHKQPQVKGDGRPRISCQHLEPDLCVSQAIVFGQSYTVRFRFNSSYTLLPWTAYDSYVGSRSISNTPVSAWPRLRLSFSSADAPIDTRRPVLKIAPQSLLGNSRAGGAQTLLLRRSPDPNSNEIVLGRTVWRSLMMYREFDTGRAIIQSFDSTKRYTDWPQVLSVIVLLALARWWMTRDALFYEALPGRFASAGTPPAIQKRLLASLPFVSNRIRRRHELYHHHQQDFLGSGDPIPVSSPTAPWGPFLNGHSSDWLYPGEWGVYPDRLLLELAAIGGGIATLYIPALRSAAESKYEFWIFLQIIVYVMVAWNILVWATRIIGRADIFGVLHYYPSGTWASFIIYRAGLIRQASVDVLLAVILLMLSLFTRTDSLGTTMATLAAGILSGVIMYHFMASIVHLFRFDYRYPVGRRGEGIWFLWILFMGLYLATAATFLSTFILIPFMQLHVTSPNVGDYILAAVVVYAAGLFLAFILVNFETERMHEWITQMRGKPAPAPKVHPAVRFLRSATSGLAWNNPRNQP